MKNILVGVDLKPSDSWLLYHATTLAQKFEAKIWLVHIAEPEPDFLGYGIGPAYIRNLKAEEFRADHRQLHAMVEELRKKPVEAEGLLIHGITDEMIELEVTKLSIDLLILGSHKHNFLYTSFVGHTANRIINDVNIPVMIVPLPYET